jgi:hypothetical protein
MNSGHVLALFLIFLKTYCALSGAADLQTAAKIFAAE